ncbi:hypothetical protein COU60_00020 [Candidatus Pacearchaeota archaeon CG10_big_fil_rev_8_21_14_0_10_34_76]|nr:MAG: hypothetical protein COU60_00020 [Candidatus Pacearchaeota archaeon CG10_big_fil_rev_8_21_14_0_10_34_76]
MYDKYLDATFVNIFFIIFIILILIPFGKSVEPSGGNSSITGSERASSAPPGSVSAQAGNVTQLDISGYTITQAWQGYYGNVTGTLVLADSSNSLLYDWSIASPSGEIYASTNSSVGWPYTQCFNYTATGTFADDTSNAGATSQFGMNLSQIHDEFNILESAPDSVDRTFNMIGESSHRDFYTSNLKFNAGQCQSTQLFDGAGNQSGLFQEILLYEPSTASVIFTSLIEQQADGFDGGLHDFEMLVLENGREGDTDITTYYLYVELE